MSGRLIFINGNNLDNGAIFIDSETKRISSDEYESIKRNLNNRTLLLSINGTLGRLAYYNGENIALGKSACFLNFKENTDRRYFRYILEMKDFKQYMFKVASGSTIKNFSPRQAAEYEFFAPKIEDQKKIASVLSALDDKIALNKKMNQKLEAMAKRLYDYWFVQYDFPDKNGHPYKTTGGPMTYNPTLKREIPAGWEVNVVGDVCETVLGGTPSTENESYWNGNIPWLNSGEVAEFPILNAEKRITEDAVKNSATAYLPAGSVTLSITRHLRPSIMAIDACINQSVAGIKENGILKNGYLYPYLVNEIPRLNTLRGGAQQPHINKDTVDKSPIVIPAQNVLHQYYEKVNPLYREIIEKAKESQKLTTLRDKLLPLLMNGQVEVG